VASIKRVPEEERQRILEEIRGGASIHATAKRFHRSSWTIAAIAHKNGIHSQHPAPQYAVTAHRNKAEFRRIQRAEQDLSTMGDNGKELLDIVARACRVRLR